MKNYCLLIPLLMFNMSCAGKKSPDTKEIVRPAAVAGSFYESDSTTLRNELKTYFSECKNTVPKKDTTMNVAAVIVPHAGYVFSGKVAASAYACINPNAKYKHIFILGPSHHVAFDGASVNNQVDAYETPLGNVKVDKTLCSQLIEKHTCFTCNPKAHDKEHCIEVQLPFLQYYLKEVPPIIPIIIGTQSVTQIREIAKALQPYLNNDNLFVISSDFSHYPDYKDACAADAHTKEGILKGTPNDFMQALSDNSRAGYKNLYTSACGQCGILALLYMMEQEKGLTIRHTMYENSGDSSYGDHYQVVGYNGFVVYRDIPEEKESSLQGDFSLTPAEKQTLLHIARQAIDGKLNGTADSSSNEEITETLRSKCGAFVTLTINGQLRGCIGHLIGDHPLYSTVRKMAAAAAFDDPRFYPLTKEEWQNVRLEISVLSPLKKINSIDEFVLGKHGILIEKNGRSGTFLPQVAEEVNWTKEEFLGHCSRDKAGLDWDGWKNASLYIYEAVVIKEEEK